MYLEYIFGIGLTSEKKVLSSILLLNICTN